MQGKLLLLIVGLILFAGRANAQQEDNTGSLTTGQTIELIQRDFIDFESPVTNDVVRLQQIGNLNELRAIQNLDDQGTYILTGEQQGNNNYGSIEQYGSNHESLLLQKGNNNSAILLSEGQYTQNRVFQDGNGNLVESYLENFTSTPKSTTSFQTGNNNEIGIDFMSGMDNPTPFGILLIQEGNNNMADVTFDNYNVPYLKIEQTGGAKVIIHNADFNYPMK